ncbi:MAG: sigma 54-interacting transcriptional regulator, partial [Desulfohalobiaceae bacterium]|nr:sigma 54-interacting transcriptional regulator [Desulfohalobiaceae bacterium]
GVQVNVRMIAATNRDLKTMVREGRFREDLFYRLNVVRVHLPPLRERGADIQYLLEHFLHLYIQKFQKNLEGFSAESQQILLAYSYPGNVRELKNVVEFAVNVCSEVEIGVQHLPGYLKDAVDMEAEEVDFFENPRMTRSREEKSPGQATWTETEKEMILSALVRAKGKKQKAAELLGWGRSTLWRKMKHHRLTE